MSKVIPKSFWAKQWSYLWEKQVHSLCVESRPGDRLRLAKGPPSIIYYSSSVKRSLKLTARLRRWPWEKQVHRLCVESRPGDRLWLGKGPPPLVSYSSSSSVKHILYDLPNFS